MADYVIQHIPGLTSMKLQKLLYYIQAWHLAITDHPLFPEDNFLAYKDGPVCETVRHARMNPETRRQPTRLPNLDSAAKGIADLVLAEFGGRTGDELSALTHIETPWIEARGGLPDGAPSRALIENESIKSFFRKERTLGGRTAADIAATGPGLETFTPSSEPIDLREIMRSLAPIPDAEWGQVFSANTSAPLAVQESERSRLAGRHRG